MKPLRIGGVPLHPAVVHFPLAAWVGAVALECLWIAGAGPLAWTATWWLLVTGCATAVLAMGAGLPDWLALEEGSPEAAVASRHALLMFCAWCWFVALLVFTPQQPPAGTAAAVHLAGMLVGLVLLVVGGHAGASLVYRYGVGTATWPRRTLPPRC